MADATRAIQRAAAGRRSQQAGRVVQDFIDEASRWYADAFEHDKAEIANLVGLYALVSRMRVFSSTEVVASADRVVRTIIEAYLPPNKTFRDLTAVIDNDTMNPLQDFSNACRDELRAHGSSH